MKKILILIVFFVAFYSRSVYGFSGPASITAFPIGASVLAQWGSVYGAIDYIVEYKPTVSGLWNIYPDGSNTKRGVVINGLLNGTSYDFRVSAVTGIGVSAPSQVATVIPKGGRPSWKYIQHILSTGQSLSLGFGGLPSLTTTQPYNNKMLSAGNTSLIPLIEPSTYANSSTVESMSSALGNMITSLSPKYQSIVTLHGKNSTSYSGLKKGTTPYANGIAQLNTAFNLANASGLPYIVSAITAIHGEHDEIVGTTRAQYEANLVQWQNDYETDAQAITGQFESVPLFTDQMHSWSGTNVNKATPEIAIAQWNAAKNNPQDIFMVTPKYIFDYHDHFHLNNYSYRRLGEYYGKVMNKVLVEGKSWLPLSPKSIVRGGNKIYATFNVPVAPITFDTTAVDAVSNYGFEYFDSINSASITSVVISGPDSVEITLSQIPTGSYQRLRYAYTGVVGTKPGAHIAGSPKGNLRDSDTTPALYTTNVPAAMGTMLRNWAITFDESIQEGTIPNPPYGVVATGSNGQAIVSFNPPQNTGGLPIVSYTATAMPGSIQATGSSSPITITGLTNGTTYTFRVSATNAVGTSKNSRASNSLLIKRTIPSIFRKAFLQIQATALRVANIQEWLTICSDTAAGNPCNKGGK